MVLYTIQPITITTTFTAQKIAMRVEDIVLFTSASVYYEIIDSTNKVIRNNTITINNNYPNWGTDDNFIYNYISALEGITGENTQTILNQNVATKMDIVFNNLHLQCDAEFKCKFYTSDETIILDQSVSLRNENYANWGADDAYVLLKISELLQISPIVIV